MSNPQDEFIEVGKSGKPITGVNTQLKIFKYLIQNKDIFNELLYRFDTQIVVQDIQNKRNQILGLDMNTIITSSVINNNNPSLYITYYKNNIQVFHMSFHLCPNCIDRKTNGLIHFKENKTNTPKNKTRNKRKFNNSRVLKTGRIINILGRSNNANIPYFKFGKNSGTNIKNQYKKEAEIILNVLNEYFDRNSNLFLGNPVNHPEYKYTNSIYNRMVNSVQGIQTSTRRIR